MNGFGTGLQSAEIQTRLFRKVSAQNFLNSGELCFSTEKSTTLISHGEFCIVLESNLYSGLYFDGDADAGKNFGYDEFRVEMDRNELLSKIEYIVVPNSWFDSEMSDEDEGYNEENDPYVWIENLSDYGIVIAERDFDGNINFNF